MNIDSEKFLEPTLRREVKKKGGLCLKWVSPGYNGVPDRIVLIPGLLAEKGPLVEPLRFPGRVAFVELKSRGEEPSELQKYVHRQLRERGFEVHVIDSYDLLMKFIESI